jgi:hypothetical protein
MPKPAAAIMKRPMRTLLSLVSLPLLATFAPSGLFEMPLLPEHAWLAATPVPLNEEAPARRRLGALDYLGGWVLTSNDPRFGGISAIHVADGAVLALSDAGSVMRFNLPGEKRAHLSIRALADGPGSADIKADRDSESMLVDGQRAWIGFEGRNAVWRYSLATWKSEARAAPRAMRKWPSNSGSEAMLRFPDGRFLVFSEGRRGPEGSTEVLLFDSDPAEAGAKATRLGYRAPDGYRITDAALLPDGRILFLNRRFTLLEGVSAKLTIGSLPKAGEGDILSGAELASFARPVTVDNMEALSVAQEAGRTIVWIASDDNFSALQRTLLLKFALNESADASGQ